MMAILYLAVRLALVLWLAALGVGDGSPDAERV